MSRFDSYFLMKPSDVVEYAREKLDFFAPDSVLEGKEIGDGNINYIFRVWDTKSGKSVIIKQAGHTARISDAFVLSTDRTRIEAEILQLEHDLAPGLVPLVYKYDDVMSTCCMEDLSDHVIMRAALIQHQKFPRFAEDISTFMVNTLLLTTDVVLDHKKKKAMVKSFINPELCEISEDLVYTEPFNNYNNRNIVFPPNQEWVEKEIYNDKQLLLEVAKLKFEFLTHAQSLIHGDLHTGSIFIKTDSTKVIDPEFAFYGPMGYDIGNVVANMIFAWANADATMSDGTEKDDYIGWVEKTILDVVDLFIKKFNVAWQKNVTEVLAKVPGFQEWYLQTVLSDTAAVTGMELSRRIVGLAQVKDITTIADEKARLRAERICLLSAKRFIMARETYKSGADFLKTLKDVAAAL
ncbi:MAG: S-methyl-5-thioribose kinase [Anaerolineae bacterium]|nr:S-methyl-5-thioribose kinase [Anaerolineae bacterium]PKO03835.1 MAG: S-methyl-5-thioribose kinase [Chloroflexi bacterium HGW-Chloroflexi-5]